MWLFYGMFKKIKERGMVGSWHSSKKTKTTFGQKKKKQIVLNIFTPFNSRFYIRFLFLY